MIIGTSRAMERVCAEIHEAAHADRMTVLVSGETGGGLYVEPLAVDLYQGIAGITLFLVPCVLMVADDFGRTVKRFTGWYTRPFRRVGNVD